MKDTKGIGRVVGVLLLVHFAAGLFISFVLLQPLASPRGFLATAAENAVQVRIAVFLLLVGNAMAVAVAIAALPVFRRYSAAVALWLLALGIVAFTLQVVDNAGLMSMLSLSKRYAEAGAAKAELFEGLAIVAGTARRWVHFSFLLAAVGWIFLLAATLYRSRLVPRALAAFVMLTALLQIIGVPLRAFLGYPPEMRLAMPLAPAYAALIVWLLVKGFDERHLPADAEAQRAKLAEV